VQRFVAPGFAAGAVTTTSDRLELLESLKPVAACLHITAEKVAHQGIHGRVLLQRCLPGSRQQGIVDDEGEVCYSGRLHGSRGARAVDGAGLTPELVEDCVYDCLLVAQAANERLSLLTADRTLLGYGDGVGWVG